MSGGRPIMVLEHVTRLADDLALRLAAAPGQGCYRITVKGEPNYTLDLQLEGSDGDHNTGGLKATAMRVLNAIPAVVAAEPGFVTALDLPWSPEKAWLGLSEMTSGLQVLLPDGRHQDSMRQNGSVSIHVDALPGSVQRHCSTSFAPRVEPRVLPL